MGYIKIKENDSVVIEIETARKYADKDIKKGDHIIKYGFSIGVATEDIKKGDFIHSHNLKTGLGDLIEYEYKPKIPGAKKCEPQNINAYARKNGNIGIRNDVWIIPTVGCVNGIAKKLSDKTGALTFNHPYGCSQLGGDMETTQKILSGLIKHPNAGGVLVLGLGCENNNIAEMKKVLGEVDGERIKFLNVQECGDELKEGEELINQLISTASKDERTPVPISKLKIGLKCGGSDGLSGITANPLVGKATDALIAMGATAVLTEVPEMFGAEEILFERCESREVFDKAVALINDYKRYFISHGQPVSENPSPGNKEGGITTLEEKSLGCVQKGGTSAVVDVLNYGDQLSKAGLNLLNGPGNDIVSVTNLAAAGCHLILFTTGRGTPLGAAVPTVKISTNSRIVALKPHWIDFDAFAGNEQALIDLITETANGRETANEKSNFREIAIFKDGVTL